MWCGLIRDRKFLRSGADPGIVFTSGSINFSTIQQLILVTNGGSGACLGRGE